MFEPIKDDGTYDMYELNRELDKVKSEVFLGKNAAFFGAIMSSMNFVWTDQYPTAATDGLTLWWNPKDFIACDQPGERVASLMHELWHPSRLHMVRCGNRDPGRWNIACDIRINRDLVAEGFKIGPKERWIQLHPEIPFELEEDIYDWLVQNNVPPPPGMGAPGTDMIELTPDQVTKIVNNAVRAITAAKAAGQPGTIPGGLEKIVNKFLTPVVPWESLLRKFFTDLLDHDYTWQNRDRRFQDIYLPGEIEDDGRLEHLAYYWDVSGSISDADEIRFNSELKHIKEEFKPKKLTLVQFDTRITDIQVFEEDDPFEEIKIVGKGGTCLRPVREHIQETKPTAAVIFSDLYVSPMKPLDEDIPIIWVVVNHPQATVPFGTKIHIKV